MNKAPAATDEATFRGGLHCADGAVASVLSRLDRLPLLDIKLGFENGKGQSLPTHSQLRHARTLVRSDLAGQRLPLGVDTRQACTEFLAITELHPNSPLSVDTCRQSRSEPVEASNSEHIAEPSGSARRRQSSAA
jgi:hypothetical protein